MSKVGAKDTAAKRESFPRGSTSKQQRTRPEPGDDPNVPGFCGEGVKDPGYGCWSQMLRRQVQRGVPVNL